MDQPYNLNCYFLLCCYFRCIFIPRNYTFEPLFYVFWELNAVIYKQSDYRDNTFGPYYFKYCTRGWCYPPSSRCSCVWYSRIYIKYWRSQTNLYFTININQRQIKKSPKLALEYFNGTTTFVPNMLLSAGVLPMNSSLIFKIFT